MSAAPAPFIGRAAAKMMHDDREQMLTMLEVVHTGLQGELIGDVFQVIDGELHIVAARSELANIYCTLVVVAARIQNWGWTEAAQMLAEASRWAQHNDHNWRGDTQETRKNLMHIVTHGKLRWK